MTNIKKRITKGIFLLLLAVVSAGISSCSKSQSYSELLREEEKAVNSFLAQQKVALEIPADSISFETGEDAPFYRMDPDGYVYMQVINKGDYKEKVEADDVVYFRFNRKNLKDIYQGGDGMSNGNSDDLGSDYGDSYFIYKNTVLDNSLQWGTGIQIPMKFFGYNCEVNLVLQSYYGFVPDQSSCQPYLINVRYFKAEY